MGMGDSQAAFSGVCRTLARPEDPNLPLVTPTDMQLAPTSTKLVEGAFCELRPNSVLRSSPREMAAWHIGSAFLCLDTKVAIASRGGGPFLSLAP